MKIKITQLSQLPGKISGLKEGYTSIKEISDLGYVMNPRVNHAFWLNGFHTTNVRSIQRSERAEEECFFIFTTENSIYRVESIREVRFLRCISEAEDFPGMITVGKVYKEVNGICRDNTNDPIYTYDIKGWGQHFVIEPKRKNQYLCINPKIYSFKSFKKGVIYTSFEKDVDNDDILKEAFPVNTYRGFMVLTDRRAFKLLEPDY